MMETVRIVAEHFRETEDSTLSAFSTRNKRCRDIARLCVISQLSSRLRTLFDFAVFWRVSFLGSRPRPAQSVCRESEKMEIRGECGGKRRTINEFRIGRALRITCRYCVIAARTRAYETTRHAYARAYTNVRRITAHVAAICTTKMKMRDCLTYFSIFSSNCITRSNRNIVLHIDVSLEICT